jgi:DHA2 family multidrug resistance protein
MSKVASSEVMQSPSFDGSPIVMHGFALAAAIFVLSTANFMAILDLTIVNVAVPHIAGALAVSPNEGTWVITSYAVAEAITVPLSGWLAARFGAVRVFVVAAFFFGLFSTLCGFATTLPMLVVFRILQGLAGGPLMPMSQTLLLRIAPPDKSNMAMGLWMMTTILAPVAGPVLGGTIVDTIGWPWAFYINIPVSIFCGAAAWMMLRTRETQIIRNPIDYVGLGLLIVFVSALQIMLDNGLNEDWFASPFIISLFIMSLLAFVMFVIWELTEEHPIVDLRIFRHFSFAVSALAIALTMGAFLASIVLIPLWLQINMGYTATWSGYMMAFQGILGVVMAPVAAALITRVDPRFLMSLGLGVLATAIFLRTGFTPDMTFGQMIMPQLAMGFGLPLLFVPLMTLSMGAVDSKETAAAAGLINFIRTTAGAMGTAIVIAAWSSETAATRVELVSTLNQPGHVLAQMQRSGITPGQSLNLLDQAVQSQAVMIATNHLFMIVGLIIAATAVGIWAMPKPSGPVQLTIAH